MAPLRCPICGAPRQICTGTAPWDPSMVVDIPMPILEGGGGKFQADESLYKTSDGRITSDPGDPKIVSQIAVKGAVYDLGVAQAMGMMGDEEQDEPAPLKPVTSGLPAAPSTPTPAQTQTAATAAPAPAPAPAPPPTTT